MDSRRPLALFRVEGKHLMAGLSNRARHIAQGFRTLETNTGGGAGRHALDKKLRLDERKGANVAGDIEGMVAHGHRGFLFLL